MEAVLAEVLAGSIVAWRALPLIAEETEVHLCRSSGLPRISTKVVRFVVVGSGKSESCLQLFLSATKGRNKNPNKLFVAEDHQRGFLADHTVRHCHRWLSTNGDGR